MLDVGVIDRYVNMTPSFEIRRLIISKVLFLVHDKPDKKDIYNILKAHGATMEGEGDCYQVSHRRWNGKLCWHKHGAAKTKCEWKTPELVFYKAGEEPEWYKELKSV